MTITEYQTLAARTIPTDNTRDMERHARYGLISEVAEMMQAIREKASDTEHIKREMGDVCWMIAELCTARCWKLSAVVADAKPDPKGALLDKIGLLYGYWQKAYQGHPVHDFDVVTSLCGIWSDLMWLAEFNGFTMDDVMQTNIDKLKRRYPNGFSAEKSMNREKGDI